PTSGAPTKPQRRPLAHLPGENGWPIVGNTLAALKDPVRHVQAMYRKHGPVYRDHVFGVRSVALLGPEANESRGVRPRQELLLVQRLGLRAGARVPGCADADGFRRASPASQGAGRCLQAGADEGLSRRAERTASRGESRNGICLAADGAAPAISSST